MSTALQLRETDSVSDWQVIRDQASMLLKSGFLPKSIATPEQALAIILTGRELGIGTMQALNNINVIQGKPTVAPQLMLALVNRSGQVEDLKIEASKDGATCTIKRKGRSAYTARFGPAEARAMGLDGKDNYKKQPATMYKWRAVADACRAVFPDVIMGLYLPDEMGAAVEVETGEVIEAQPLPPADEPRTYEDVPEVEPEPVKLEGPQPTDAPYLTSAALDTVGPKTAQILEWLRKMKWDANDLANYIFHQFKLAVDEGDAVKAISALEPAQKKTLHQMIEAEVKARGCAR